MKWENNILQSFDPEFVRKIYQRIYAKPDSVKFNSQNLDNRWSEVATFHDDLVNIVGLTDKYFVNQKYVQKNQTMQNNNQFREYYFYGYHRDLQQIFCRLVLPFWNQNMLNWPNDKIDTCVDKLTENIFNLTIVPMSSNKPMNKGIFMPFLKKSPMMPEAAEPDDQFYIFKMDYDPEKKTAKCSYYDSDKDISYCDNSIRSIIQEYRGRK